MALQPPSFFQAPSKTSQKQLKDVKQESSSSEQLALPCALHFPSASSTPGLQVARQPAAVLTNDLLAVEAHLQSRMRLLEEEKKNLVSRIVELEQNVIRQKEEKEANIELLKSQHNTSLVQAQFEVRQLRSECGKLKEEGQSKLAQVESECREREEHHSKEVRDLSAKLKQLEEQSEALQMELERTREECEKETCTLRDQLTTVTSKSEEQREDLGGQLRSMKDEVEHWHRRVCELEGYLGGEIPRMPKDKDGSNLTWREERERLVSIIDRLECDLHKVKSEDQLLNIRLSSLTEILTIQDSVVTKESQATFSDGRGLEGRDAESAGALKMLLTRWREKVFVLLVQQKLFQIGNSRLRHEVLRKEAELVEHIQRVEREKELLSHSLEDRNAELQLQISKTNLAEERLAESLAACNKLQQRLLAQGALLSLVAGQAQSVSQSQGSCLASLNQALTKMASYEHRINMMSGRISAVKATLNYQLAVQQRAKVVTTANCCVQTESEEREGGSEHLTSLSRMELIEEVRSLSRERSKLAHQLEESTVTFQQQLESLKNSCSSKLATTEARLSSTQRENCSLSEELSQLKTESESVTQREGELKLRVGELEGELRDTKASLETRVDLAVQEQQRANSEGMAEMDKLLSVARREHGKAVVQLQQLQRQVSRDKERAMEAMALNQTRLEHQLETCRKKLEASQVERNLLMTVLRQEGIAVPLKQRGSPRRREREVLSDGSGEEGSSCHCEEGEERESTSTEDSCQPPQGQCDQTQPPQAHEQDIREVLKDLQFLSSSLLEMEKPHPQLTVEEQQLSQESKTKLHASQ